MIHTAEFTATHPELQSSLWEFGHYWDFWGEKKEHEGVPVTPLYLPLPR